MTVILLSMCFLSEAQSFDSWRVGGIGDVDTNHGTGVLLAGGGADQDDAMRWMLEKAQGGDVVILRASGEDGYNSYFFTNLGISLNAVETIRINSREGANDTYVSQRIREAEVLFIAGGDQTSYYDLWNQTATIDAIQYLIADKKATVGGTSAGMAILSEFFYIPQTLGILSEEALTNPFHPYMKNIRNGGFLTIPVLENTINDTHFDDRNRAGRLVTMMARMEQSFDVNARGIACNDGTAIAIEDGSARVFGYNDDENAFAYFLQSNCNRPQSIPEICMPGAPLTWDQSGDAVKVYRIRGNEMGSHSFNLSNWSEGTGGQWWDWSVLAGTLKMKPGSDELCRESTATMSANLVDLAVNPNPFRQEIVLNYQKLNQEKGAMCEIFHASGTIVYAENIDPHASSLNINTSNWKAGVYTLCITQEKQRNCTKITKLP